ncbi:MAG: DUF6048 family protein [Bacteroidales bacterium]|jgi:hypothetical protein|nr:DUF6048 family protein [Bacteroidales bacterium]MDD3161907.1 DUF6048 family protein [Bacteroidales bacterium]
MKRISAFICSLLVVSLFAFSVQAAGKSAKKAKVQQSDTIPLYNGFSVGLDLLSPFNSLFGNGYIGSELSVDYDLKHRYFPVVELGGGHYEGEKDGLSFRMNGGFGRIGVNRNIFANNQAKFFGYLGARYGFASEQYDYLGVKTTDGYWNTTNTSNLLNQSAQTHWTELLAGVRVQIYKKVSLGWIIRYHFRLSQTSSKAGKPYYVPGYGKNESTGVLMNYSLYYTF